VVVVVVVVGWVVVVVEEYLVPWQGAQLLPMLGYASTWTEPRFIKPKTIIAATANAIPIRTLFIRSILLSTRI
jgi:hypothetical protein